MKLETSFGVIPLRKHSGVWEVLLVQHLSGNHWGFPKGKAEDMETSRETASRELLEETGLKIKRYLTDVEIKEHYDFIKGGEEIKKSVTYFIAEVQGNAVFQKDELFNLKWVPLFEAEAHLTFPEARNVCLQAISLFDSFDLTVN